MKTYYFLLFATIIILFSCTTTRTNSINNNWGCVKISRKYWDSVTSKFVYMPQYGPEFKIWYKDSLRIEEVIGLNSGQENNGPEKIWFTQEPYIFIDLKKQYYFKYSSFIDTAKLLEKINKTDSVKWGIPWDFYAPVREFYRENLTLMDDTLIDGIVFKRWLKEIPSFFKGLKRITKHILYLRCDKKNTSLQFDSWFMKNKGCPLVRVDMEYFSSEIKFLTDTLTPEEIKVFDAWEKRARKD